MQSDANFLLFHFGTFLKLIVLLADFCYIANAGIIPTSRIATRPSNTTVQPVISKHIGACNAALRAG